jgi:tripartite-type tricarboxylate transporter receptor subunit TctC
MENAGMILRPGHWTGALLALMLACGAAAAQEFPTRNVRIVVPAAGGSTTDTLARLLADGLQQRWGKPVVVDNVAGGAMNIGSAQVARAEPDGHTLLVAPPSPLAINQLLYKSPGYDPTQFTPVTLLARIPNALVVRPELPARSVQELIAHAKANPGKVTYASQGAGSTAHLSAAQLEVLAGVQMQHVPYRGAVPALTDVMGNRVDMFFDTLTTSVPLHQEGKVRIIAVAGTERSPALPDVPTVAESGLPGFRSVTWFGLVAPPATPASIVDRINMDAMAVLTDKDVAGKLKQIRLDAVPMSPAQTKAFFAEETALWGKVIKDAKIEAQ